MSFAAAGQREATEEEMKVLMVHNRYQQRGGEDAVVDAEARLLAANGIDVQRFDADNDAIARLRDQDSGFFRPVRDADRCAIQIQNRSFRVSARCGARSQLVPHALALAV